MDLAQTVLWRLPSVGINGRSDFLFYFSKDLRNLLLQWEIPEQTKKANNSLAMRK